MAAPHVKKLAADMAGKGLVPKVDTDAHPDVAARYEVRSIPNFVVFKNGQAVFQLSGVVPAAQMKQWIEAVQGRPSTEVRRSRRKSSHPPSGPLRGWEIMDPSA